jgi:hypothetical protein
MWRKKLQLLKSPKVLAFPRFQNVSRFWNPDLSKSQFLTIFPQLSVTPLFKILKLNM